MVEIPQIIRWKKLSANKGRGIAVSAQCCLTIFLVFLSVLSLGMVSGMAYFMKDLPSVEQLPVLLEPPDGILLQPTKLFDRGEKHILLTLQNPEVNEKHFFTVSFNNNESQNKKNNASRNYPSSLITATIIASDPDFLIHNGCNFTQRTQGNNSTITQQLVTKTLLVKEMSDKQRGFSSCLLAINATKHYGREKVLEWYLNSTYYGNLAYGADAASQVYFDKYVTDLSLAEAAMLAAINNTPSLNPIDAPKAARENQLNLLQEMLRAQVITPAEAEKAAQEELHINQNGGQSPKSRIASEFTDYVLMQLETKYDRYKIERGGLKIITTLDYEIQNKINCVQYNINNDTSDANCDGAKLLDEIDEE